jgi:hypothetical protein
MHGVCVCVQIALLQQPPRQMQRARRGDESYGPSYEYSAQWAVGEHSYAFMAT